MRLANHDGRACLVLDGDASGDGGSRPVGHGSVGLCDVATLSDARFGSDPMALLGDWSAFVDWARQASPDETHRVPWSALSAPVPRPRQAFGVGTNYADHADEEGQDRGQSVFSKLPPSITGPYVTVELPTTTVDWEVEVVAVGAVPTFAVRAEHVWERLAGLMVGQDISERTSQFAGELPQFSLAKSRPGFGPTGPWLTTLDELDDAGDLAVACWRNDELMQYSRTSTMILDIPAIIQLISAAVPLLPGDLVFTGTPAGVGHGRRPPQYLSPGDSLTTRVDGLGFIEQHFRAVDGRL